MTNQNNAVPQPDNGEQSTSVLPQYPQPSYPGTGEQPTPAFPQFPQTTHPDNSIPPAPVDLYQHQSDQQQFSEQQMFNVPPGAPAQPNQSNARNSHVSTKDKKPLWKKWWFWVIVVVVLAAIGSALGMGEGDTGAQDMDLSATPSKVPGATTDQQEPEKDPVLQSITATYTGSTDAGTSVDINSFSITGTYDDGSVDSVEGCTVSNPGALVGEQATTFTIDCGGVTTNVVVTGVTPVPIEYQNALVKANQYSDMMHMSKQGIYDQLVSEYGEQFSPEAAQWAIDHMTADWNANALQKAKDYQDMMAMSPAAIYDQLISEYGEKFTPEEAQYAIDNLNK